MQLNGTMLMCPEWREQNKFTLFGFNLDVLVKEFSLTTGPCYIVQIP